VILATYLIGGEIKMAADRTTDGALGEFVGAAVGRAITTLARGDTLAPFGVSRKKGILGVPEENKSFVETKVVGKIDLSESAQAALQWMEDEIPRAESCLIVFDGFLNSDEGRVDAVIGRVAALGRQLLVEIAQPYRKGDGRFSIAEVKYRFMGIAGDDQTETTTNVDAAAFDTAYQKAFRAKISGGA
jgi:hypothetical protein